ncbi:MAG: PAS domain S-box protein, partial [Promethearchaeota archaeon]
ADLVTIIDITEKREAEQKLKESEEKFRTIAEQSSIGITILQDNEIKFINHKVSEELGYPHEEIKNWKLADLVKTVHPEDRDFIREQAIKKQVGEKDVVVEYEYRLFNKNGDIIWVKNLSKTITYNGRPADFISQVYITDMKRTEEKLKESEEKFRSLAEESSIGITILQDNEMKFFNGRLAEQAGYLRDEIKDWDLTTLLENLVHPDDRDFVREQAIKKQKGEKDVVNEYEYRFIHKNGDIRWTRTISKTILYNGRPADFISHIDITDIKETELQLRESEERYRHLFNISPFAVFIMNSNGIILDVNDTTEELFSIEKGDLVGKLSLNILNFPPETFKLLQKRQDSLINGKQVDPVEFQVTLKDGRKRWINSNLSAFTINHEIFFHAIIQDVTDRKDSELKLKESELKFRSIFEAIPDIYFLVTGDTTILDYKGNLNDFYLTPESFMGKKLTDIMPVKIARESLIAVKKTIETREPQVLEYDLELIKDLKSFEARLLYLSDDQVLIFVRDITERKRAEENLKRSEEKFRGIIEKNYDGYYEVNLRGDYIVASKEICDFMGYSEEELIGTNFSLYVIDKYIPWIKKQYNELYNYKKQQIILEYEIITKLGEEKYIEIAAYLKTDSNGERIGFYGISRDINLQKKLEESEEKYRNLFNTAPFGIALFNFKGIIIDINNALLQLIGLSLEDVIGKHYKEFHLYPEMEYLNFKARQNKIHNGELPKPRELLIYNKNGKKIWISSQLSFVQIGEMRFIQAIINDISERKTAEDELKASEANYRKAFDRANFYKDLFAHDMNNILQGVLSSVELYSLFNKNQDNTVDINEILEIIKESANRGAQLISNVQKLSRVDDLNIELQKINLCYFLNEAINFLRKKYHDKEILIHIETNTNDINVNANELLLDAFENLLINAVSYNNQKIIEILIKISFVKKVINEYVKIEFIDNGIGVEDSRKDKIFEVGNREYKGGKGMGIGLSLVKKTIESYGGEINVQDKIQGDHSKGSNFIVLIPKN